MFNMELRTRGGKSAGFGFRAVAVAALFLAAGLASSCYAQSSGNEISLSGGRADDSIGVIGLRVGKPIGYWDFASCLGFEEADLEYWNAPHQYHASGDLTTIGAASWQRAASVRKLA
jgi:hypothetical protein